MNALLPFYPWVKALHLISVIAWMAGMLYLPRLFVYHATVAVGSEASETFKVMERRLLKAIMNPAMIATLLFGAMLAGTPGAVDWRAMWFPVKLILVVMMLAIHYCLFCWQRDFAEDRNSRSAKFYRVMNEVPTLLLIGIVLLAVAKPF